MTRWESSASDPNASGLSGTSYVINEYVAYPTLDGYSVLNINWIKNTSKLIVMFEGADQGRTVTDDHVHTSTWYAPGDIVNGNEWALITAEVTPTQHVSCSNYLYADGHADTVSLEDFYSWVQTDIANALTPYPTNFARPVK